MKYLSENWFVSGVSVGAKLLWMAVFWKGVMLCCLLVALGVFCWLHWMSSLSSWEERMGS